MEDLAKEGKAVGILFDLSLRQGKDGIRLLDSVKENMIDFVRKSFEDGYDAMYLYHPHLTESTYKIGENNSSIGNYETDGWSFNLEFALKQTLFVVAAEEMDLRKYVILITDRLQNQQPIEKVIHLNRKDRLDVHTIIVGIGDHYNKQACQFAELFGKSDDSITYFHLDDPLFLVATLLKEDIHGGEDICCKTSEQCE